MSRIQLNDVKEHFMDLQPKYIMPWLLKYNVVSEIEKYTILALDSQEKQVEKLFEILPSKGSKGIVHFKKILNMEDDCGYNYPWLAGKLNSVIDTDSVLEVQQSNLDNHVYQLLINGGVPFPTNCLLRRKNKIEEVRSALVNAANKRHWVVLHGMPGTGKSILAAEAIRDNYLINSYFKDGVFWVKLGEVDNNKLQIKMMKLYLKISESESKHSSRFENLDDLSKNLKKSVSPAMLLILDDLWGQLNNTVALFDVGCPILVTTRYPGLFDNYTQYTSKIKCKNDFSRDESKELLALYAKCDKKDLPDSVDYISQKCKGFPFMLSNIGGWVSPFGNDINRWNSLKALLEQGLKRGGRQRDHSDNDMKKVLCLMVDQIENDDKDFFYDFVIFPEDVWVPTQVFTILWDLSALEVEDIMYRLARNSLVQYERDPVYSYSYGIHDLYLEVLKEKGLNIPERHENFVNKYIKLCKTQDGKYDFGLLPDDDYIHYYIGQHMQLADQDSFVDEITFDDIFFDLKFIEMKLRKDPKDILYDYQTYRNMFKNKKTLDIYKQFAAKHASDIFKNKHDIVQLGLFEPQDSIIYLKATDIALRSKDKSYYKWCNQAENLSQMQNLNLKLQPFEDTTHATISYDGLLVACVGNGKDAKIFSTCSGEILYEFRHTHAIHYCMFNSNSTRLVTASKDKTVRIFELDIAYSSDMKPTRKRASLPLISTEAPKTPDASCVFAEHQAPVLCCCYSADEDLIVSSDCNGVVHVWQSSSTYLKCTVHHVPRNLSPEPVHNCSFNSDSSIFGTAAYDSIKLWFTNGGRLYKEFFHNEIVVEGFCFTFDNRIISVADNKIFFHDVLSGGVEHLKYTKNCLLTCCCLSADGKYLACGTSYNNVIVFLVHTGKLIQDFKGHKSYIVSVEFTNDGKKLLAVSVDGYFLYDMSYVKNISFISCEGNLSVRQNLKDLTIATSNRFQCIEVRKGITGELVRKTERDKSDITACSLSIDCSEVVYGTKDGDVKVFSLQNGISTDLPKHGDQINYITHLNNNIFFTCSEDKTVKIWDNKCSITVRGHYKAVLMCVPFKQSSKLLTCSRDGTLKVWNIDTGDFILSTEGHGNYDVRCCDVSYDDKLLASGSADRTVKLWNAENGMQMYETIECESEVRCCRFSPSFQVLICGCDSGEVGRCILSKKIQYKKLAQQSCDVYNICFSKDGSQFLTISDEIKIWKNPFDQPQTTLYLPSSSMGVDRSSIWASDNFDTLVTIVNSYLYILQKISTGDNN